VGLTAWNRGGARGARRGAGRRVKTLLGFVVLVLALPRPADACEPPPCWSGYFVPGDGAHVPANLPGLYWRPMGSVASTAGADPAKVTLVPDGGAPIALTATQLASGDFVLVPAQPLVAGTHYRLTDDNICEQTGSPGPDIQFTATAGAPLPTALGTVSVVDGDIASLDIGTAAGSCSVAVVADRSNIALVPDASAQPWLDVLMYETRVDGALWNPIDNINSTNAPGASWQGRGTDLVYRVCDTNVDLLDPGVTSDGTHAVELRATLAGDATTMLATPPAQIDLACTPDAGVDPEPRDMGCSSSSGAGLGGVLIALGLLLAKWRCAIA
jgi:hypothetical protein